MGFKKEFCVWKDFYYFEGLRNKWFPVWETKLQFDLTVTFAFLDLNI